MSTNRAQHARDLILIFGLALLYRLALLFFFPTPYGNDAAGRLYFRDEIWTWHWLPVTQVLVHVSHTATHSVAAVRLLFALVTSLAAVAFTFYLQAFCSRRTTLFGGALFATNSLFVFLSLMPYQEVVFLGLLLGSLAFFAREADEQKQRRNFAAGALLYGGACLTRYEAWLILPALALAKIRREFVTHPTSVAARHSIASLAGFGWGPALWLLLNWQHWGSPIQFLFHRPDHAFYAWAPHGEIARIVEYLGRMIYWMGRFGSPLVLLALPGVAVAWKYRQTQFSGLWPLLLLLVIVLIFLVFIAGREFATANRFASIPLSVMLVFVAIGADAVIDRAQQSAKPWLRIWRRPRLKAIAVGLVMIFLLIYGAVPVAQANRLAEFREPYEIAKFFTTHLSSGQSAVIVAESLEGAVPMPYQRIFGQLDFDRDHLLCAFLIDPKALGKIEEFIRMRNVKYVAVFAGEWPKHDNDETFLQFMANSGSKTAKVMTLQTATVYEIFP
jgi:hypothetical protein